MEESKDLHLLGVNFRTAPAAVREILSFSMSGALTSAHAEQVVLRSMKRLLHGHVRRLRGLPSAPEVAG